MRFKIFNKGSFISTIFGISEKEEKVFRRSVICIEEEGKVYKVMSLMSSEKDESIYVFFNYCKEKKAFALMHRHEYKPGAQFIGKDKVTHEFNVDDTVKLSLHRSGFVQLSGRGIVSGIDKVTGKAKGIGLFSSPLENPVSSGPTLGFLCWGLDKGFEELKEDDKKKDFQYIILSKERKDFEYREMEKGIKSGNFYYGFDFFIFPKEANKFVYEHDGKPYINHILYNYLHKPGAMFAHPVLDLKFFSEVMCVFPFSTLFTDGFSSEADFGYVIGSPGGSESEHDNSKTGFNFHLICPQKINRFSEVK